MESAAYHSFRYTFRLDNGVTKTFVVQLERDNLHLVGLSREPPPDWARLEAFRCPHCPLDPAHTTHCPVAASLTDLVSFFRDSLSHQTVDLLIETEERSFGKRTSLQAGVASLLGIYMVTSGCPVMGRLKPMVRFHLPFATLEETKYRAISMYLVAQYVRQRKGLTPDWSLQGLVKIYDDIGLVNQNVAERLQALDVRDAQLNAIAILGSFAQFTAMSIDYGALDDLDALFDGYVALAEAGTPA
jgi:hypothetical protein